jgi:hypothetical protein
MRIAGTCCSFSIKRKVRTRKLLPFLSLLPKSDYTSIQIGGRQGRQDRTPNRYSSPSVDRLSLSRWRHS